MNQNQLEDKQPFKRFTKKSVLVVTVVSLFYLGWLKWWIGLREDHVQLLVVCLIAFFVSDTTRKILYGMMFLLLYWFVYDSLRIYPNYMFNDVHLIEPYELEKAWFGIQTPNGLITPNEYYLANKSTFLDVMTGFFYLSWIPVPMMFSFYLFFKNKKVLLQFTSSFFLVNVIGISVYYLYPAAPPWYIVEHGFTENFNIIGNAAGLLSFDEYFGVEIFKGIYNKNGNVFAAIPSMHSAFPVLLFYFGWKLRLKFAMAFFFICIIGIWFSAVYSTHHYIIDVLSGAGAAVTTLILIELIVHSKANILLEKYESIIR